MLGFSYGWDWGVVFNAATGQTLLIGLEYTLLISGVSLAAGTFIGLTTAVMRLSTRRKYVTWPIYLYVNFFRTTPALVQLIWVFYVLPVLLNVSLSPVQSGIITLSLNAGAFLSEIFRSGLESVHKGQSDAAHVLGMSRLHTLQYIVVPQAVRRVLPAIGNVFISLLKDSSLVSVIAVSELTYQIQTEVGATFRPLELYTALAVVYFLITYPLSLATSALERRFRVT
jgi:His/Glu/Gln/Arg/opine family amino acid ABC transporter permease subunit